MGDCDSFHIQFVVDNDGWFYMVLHRFNIKPTTKIMILVFRGLQWAGSGCSNRRNKALGPSQAMPLGPLTDQRAGPGLRKF